MSECRRGQRIAWRSTSGTRFGDEFRLTRKGKDLLRKRNGGLIGQMASVRRPLQRVPMASGEWTMDPKSTLHVVLTMIPGEVSDQPLVRK